MLQKTKEMKGRNQMSLTKNYEENTENETIGNKA